MDVALGIGYSAWSCPSLTPPRHIPLAPVAKIRDRLSNFSCGVPLPSHSGNDSASDLTAIMVLS
jgi:hypothetical protein